MQHLEDGFLHALADGEVPSDELGPVREHLEACDACRSRLDEARLEAETARELIEVLEVPSLAPVDRRIGGSADRGAGRPAAQWIRPLALAASLALAAGIGYYGRGAAPFASPAAEPTSLGRIDTVFLDVPAESGQRRENDSNRDAALNRVTRPAELQAAPPLRTPATGRAEARSEVAGARREDDKEAKRTLGDSSLRLDELVVTAADAPKASPSEKKENEAKLGQVARQRAASDSRDQSAALARKAAPQPAAPAALAEERFMAKSAADAAPMVVTFPRAVELLGGRIRLIEGMVPSRLEAMGRTVRVVYVLDEGDLVLSQVSGADSLSWNLAGPLTSDSLVRLRLKVR